MKSYWMICIESYEIDGLDVPRGTMKYHTSERPITSSNWRRATEEEVNNRVWNPKGITYKWYLKHQTTQP